jgi:hypothetical protein
MMAQGEGPEFKPQYCNNNNNNNLIKKKLFFFSLLTFRKPRGGWSRLKCLIGLEA